MVAAGALVTRIPTGTAGGEHELPAKFEWRIRVLAGEGVW